MRIEFAACHSASVARLGLLSGLIKSFQKTTPKKNSAKEVMFYSAFQIRFRIKKKNFMFHCRAVQIGLQRGSQNNTTQVRRDVDWN